MGPLRHIGVVTAGGDCPGMNAALRAIVKSAVYRHGLQMTGFLDGFAGLLADQSRPLEPMTSPAFSSGRNDPWCIQPR
jgi:6-phosphofructokinase 1